MNIAVIGLGLIGGSLCKAFKKYTDNIIWGIDSDSRTIENALSQGAIDKEIATKELAKADLTIIALYPLQAVDFVKKNADNFKENSIVIDICGVKKYVVDKCTEILKSKNVHFVGTHPMAGREFSGFDYSLADLFLNASFIITPIDESDDNSVQIVYKLAEKIGFGKIVICTPQKHDEVIAYTSQLAHVVSNAYVKSPALFENNGFSAGSFLDLTRVAKLNEDMWTDLFMCNKEPLIKELENIVLKINEYTEALKNSDAKELHALLKDGRERKEKSAELFPKRKKDGSD